MNNLIAKALIQPYNLAHDEIVSLLADLIENDSGADF